MHCKPPTFKAIQQMASVSGGGGGGGADDDGDGSRSGKSISLGHPSPRSCASNNNNNNNNDSTSNTTSNPDDSEIQLKKQTLEQRKQELEKLLSEKSWLLQQLQKQEAQILNGNYEYLNLNEIFGTLQQSKQDASGGSAVLRRKSASGAAKENHHHNNNIDSNRHSEISNRSSEYDNYPGEQKQVATQQLPVVTGVLKVLPKKRQPASSGSSWHAANTLPQVQQPHHQQQPLRQQYVAQMTEQQHFQYTQQQVLQHQQQQQQQRQLLQHQHYHPRQQLITAYHAPALTTQATDGISLYSANSAHLPTLRQPQPPLPHIAAHLQTPIAVQCEKYYLSPTHQSYSDGGFIKSSQNIKQYISPLASPSKSAAASHTLGYEQHPLKPSQQQHVVSSRSFDAISLSPSFAASIEPHNSSNNNNIDLVHINNSNNLRWRSQSNIQYSAASSIELKTHSTDMLLGNLHSPTSSGNYYTAASFKCKPLDEISIASFSSETQKKSKPKQWLESSLDGPAVRTNASNSPINLQQPARPSQAKPHAHIMQRERPRLSSQSMSSGGQRYNSVTQRGKAATRLLQDDDSKYAKLSQSTSYLNSMDVLAVNTYFPEVGVVASSSPVPPPKETTFHYIPPKIATRPLPLPAAAVAAAVEKPALSPEIRIESPKNMTVVQQATFQPYKEITKPFEMSDFYKYSTKFKHKEAITTAAVGPAAGKTGPLGGT